MKPTWKDDTSYSREERGNAEPRSWVLTPMCATVPISIVVHRMHGVSEAWFLSCAQVRIDRRDLDTAGLETAKARALAMVRARLRDWSDALDVAMGSP